MTHPLVIGLCIGAATWDAWRWYATRLSAEPEQGLALALTLGVFALLAMPRWLARRPAGHVPLLPVAALLALYSVLVVVAPSIFQAAVAVIAVLYVAYRAVFDRTPPLAFYGLVALSLPVLPSLQFVLGYPMRLVSAWLTVGLLELHGLGISRQGTFVVINGETVQFDAPCSGVSSLWALVLVALFISLVRNVSTAGTVAMVALAGFVAIGANVIRVASLLYAEANGWTETTPALHEGIGLVAFGFAALAICAAAQRFETFEVRPCAA